MKISTRGRYALKMMMEFAKHPDTPTKINQVSKAQGISEKYLEQIVSILTKSGCVTSIRGASGGYLLNRPAKDYTVGEILRLTEGSLAPVFCLEENGEYCDKEHTCVTKRLFKRVENAINEIVDHTTIADLLADEEKLLSKS